jgi:hypothetical protein
VVALATCHKFPHHPSVFVSQGHGGYVHSAPEFQSADPDTLCVAPALAPPQPPDAGRVHRGHESYPELGSVKTFVRYLDEVKERHRDAMYAMSRGRLAPRAEGYVLWSKVGQFRAVIEQMPSHRPR